MRRCAIVFHDMATHEEGGLGRRGSLNSSRVVHDVMSTVVGSTRVKRSKGGELLVGYSWLRV